MVTNRYLIYTCVLLAAVVEAVPQTLPAQHTTARHVLARDEESSKLTQAEAAIAAKNYLDAEKLLLQVTESSPKDYRGWFDLGSVYEATGRQAQAIDAYRKSVAANSELFEPTFNLARVLIASGDTEQALSLLTKATTMKPLDPSRTNDAHVVAWGMLARAERKSNPEEAINAYKNAEQLAPEDEAVHLELGQLLESQGSANEAQQEYLKVLSINPKSVAAMAGLVNTAVDLKQPAVAMERLQDYIKLDPNDAQAHVQLGRLLASSGQYEGALAEFSAAQKLAPGDLGVLRQIAGVAALQKKYDVAESQYATLLKANPSDASLHYALGTTLMDDHKFAAAESELMTAVRLDPKLVEAYGNLAVSASENRDYEMAIQALDARTRFQPDDAGSFFLRATSYDHLRQYKEASKNYRSFLAASNGKFPDQEWEARHRLVAIEHEK